MGKFIICNGKQAEKPYFIKLTNTYLYTIEELCYYIYENYDSVSKEMFGHSLVLWLKEEIQLTEGAEKLKELIQAEAGLKDLVVCILCCADYYTESEIKLLIHKLDELEQMTPFDKRKRKADNFLKYRQYNQAAAEYESILNGSEAVALSSTDYGNLLHNLAITRINTLGVLAASDTFKEAYERNHRKETLKQYIMTLILGKQEERIKKEILNESISEETRKEIEEELKSLYLEAEETEDYQIIDTLKEYKESGKMVQFYQMAGDLIGRWKKEFRLENS